MSSVIIRRKAGQQIPEDFLKLALEKCPKVWGFAVVADNKLETKTGTLLELADVRQTEVDFNDVPFSLYLSSADKATNLADVSPYDLIGDADDNPIIAGLISGEFPGYVKEKSSMSSAHHLATEIANQAQTIYDILDKDLGKTMNKLGEKSFAEKIKMNAVSVGHVMLVAQNGATITLSQGDTAKEFPWGWVSNTFGYGEKEKEADPPPKKKGGLLSRSTVREKVEHQPSNNVIEKGVDQPPPKETAVQAPKAEAPPPKKVPITLSNITIKKIGIPGHYPRKLAKRWIKGRIGHCPPNYAEEGAKFEMYVGPDGAHMTLQEVKAALGIKAAELPKLTNPKADSQKDVEPKNIDSSAIASNPRPLFSAASRERFQTYFSTERVKKIIGENAGLVTDPENVQGFEGKIAAMHQQLGMKDTSDFDALPFIEFEAIGRSNIHDLAVCLWHYKTEALKARKQLEKLKPKKSVEELKAEHQLAQEELKPKKGLLARRAG